eukprot:CAMPEP_0113563608 /NCGR_PEP_ID=MMETSP0015_2-20120614/21162_1 /TAXON_ID=2838 /ORGANISM="Odontella" /LENGTH=449 /DNA_ID=CAMNT_0000465605 /DNA_START=176 /DNA_END=1525 /DNA_ORIENTATION=- /assembly_acc=CAM_ASM_000160
MSKRTQSSKAKGERSRSPSEQMEPASAAGGEGGSLVPLNDAGAGAGSGGEESLVPLNDAMDAMKVSEVPVRFDDDDGGDGGKEEKKEEYADDADDDAAAEGGTMPRVLSRNSLLIGTMPRVRSENTLLIEQAFNEEGPVNLLLHGETEMDIEPPLDITDVEAMEAASIEIKAIIRERGSITALETAEIVQSKMKMLKLLWTHFPGAVSSADVLEGYKRVAEKRGYTPENTLFAQSICPDEVNHEEGDVTDLLASYCGEVFHMGGLAGIPFTGKVGFGAFSHHVPEGDGHCAILMAPHIGIDEDGRFGAYTRDGQTHSGSCCGAAVGAYVHCRSGKPIPDLSVDPEFYQFNYIINQVHRRMDEIVGETECAKQASLARFMHRIGEELLDKCVGTNFGSEESTLIVMTGIQINMPRPFDDYFFPIDFYIQRKDGSREDVFEEAFGPRRAER